jgi:hypothetical protein
LPAGLFSLWKYTPYGKHVRKLIIDTFDNVVIKTVLDEKCSGQAYFIFC